jgi:type IX secretion system PorP/SprF family membrane protein
MKKLLFLFITSLVLFSSESNAQQVSQWGQFYFNDFYLNPAIAGVKDYAHINLSARRQWAGIKEAPIAQVLSGHGYVGAGLGLGGVIVNEIAGPTRRTGINLSASYHLRLSKKAFGRRPGKTLSFGLAAVLNQHYLDNTKLTTYEPNDIAVENGYNNQIMPDANAGIYFSNGNKYYVGFSAFNLIQSKTDLYDNITKVNNSLKRHYFLTGGYNWEVNNRFSMQPALLFQMIEATPFQFDINYRFIFDQTYYFGLGYRHLDAVSGHAGYQKGFFRIGYSYDYAINDLRAFTSGSHEVSLGFLFFGENIMGKKKSKRGKRTQRSNVFQPQIIDF